MTVHLRALRRTDRDEYFSILAAFLGYAGDDPLQEEELTKLFQTATDETRNYHVIVASDDTKIIGMISVTFGESSYKVAPFAWCDDLFVSEALRGQGVGQRLVDAAAELARTHGCSNILLGVGEDEDDAQAFYKGIGFVDLRNKLFSLPL